MNDQREIPRQPVARSRAAAALALGFLWPGLGHWYLGLRRAALWFAVPVGLVAIVFAVRAIADLRSLLVSFIDPTVALTTFVLIVLLGAWRLLALADGSGLRPRRLLLRGRIGVLFGVFAALIVATHLVMGALAWSVYDTASTVFVTDPTPRPTATAAPILAGQSATPSLSVTPSLPATPFSTPTIDRSRVTVLLTGIDKTDQRTHSLTDTLLVVSLDPLTHQLAMVSFPRDIAEFPLYSGGTFRPKINSLMTYATQSPSRYPDGPLPTLVNELSFLLGIPIQYYAAVDIDGFRRLVDEVGGVTVTVERAINDYRYNWLDGSPHGFHLAAGTQTLDGRTALAFVRSRYGAGDNDFTRAARQQQLIVALRDQLTQPSMLTRLPGLLGVVRDTVRTNFPPDRLDDMVGFATAVTSQDIHRVVLQPPTYSVHPPTNTTGGTYILRLDLAAVRQLSVDWFGIDSRFWTGRFTSDGKPIPAGSHAVQ